MMRSLNFFGLLLLGFLLLQDTPGAPPSPPGGDPILCEAESFTVLSPGWQVCPWGSNYFAAVYSNSFLSRQAALSLPAQHPESRAYRDIRIEHPGRYALLVRYEAPFRYETQFTVLLEQGGTEISRQQYGIRNNPRIWAFGRGVTEEIAWPWGANENIVWEGQDSAVDLTNGIVRLTLIAGLQPTPAAQRNIDAFLLTTNRQAITDRIRTETAALPFDGWLTQAGDLYLRYKRASPGPALILAIPPGIERSPGPVHLRTWKPLSLTCDQTGFGPWIEAGHLLDSLSAGVWHWTLQAASNDPNPLLIVECGQRDSDQQIQPFAQFKIEPPGLSLTYDGNLAQTHQLLSLSDCLQNFQQAGLPDRKAVRLTRFPIHPPSGMPLLESISIPTNPPSNRLTTGDGSVSYPDLQTLQQTRDQGRSIRIGPVVNLTPIGSPQWLTAAFDLAALGGHHQSNFSRIADIPAFSPGTDPGIWRRLVFSALARGVRGLDFGEAVPSPLTDSAYPLNDPDFLAVIRQTLLDIAASEDILMDGNPDPAWAAIWVSETGRTWNDGRPPFGAHNRALYLALCHAQMPIAYVDEADATARLKGCQVLVVTDTHVSIKATRLIADWVERGGALLTTAGAGWKDEFGRPNSAFLKLTGLIPQRMETPLPDRIDWEKQDLPWAKPFTRIHWLGDGGKSPVFAAWAHTALQEGDLLAKFNDGSPAVVFRNPGRGTVLACNFLPGFTYLQPALPPLPLDRNSDPNSTLNRLPSGFDLRILNLMRIPAAGIERTVLVDHPAIEVRRICALQGWVIAAINWSSSAHLETRITVPHYTADFTRIFRASGEPINTQTHNGNLVLNLRLNDADLIIFR